MRKYTPLDYKDLEEDLLIEEPLFDGIHYIFEFDNTYQVSVVKHAFSYGGNKDFFEIMILISGRPIEDPIGWLTNAEVLEKLKEVKMRAKRQLVKN